MAARPSLRHRRVRSSPVDDARTPTHCGVAALALGVLLATGCAAPTQIAVANGRPVAAVTSALDDCAPLPNCVSSDATTAINRVDALAIDGDAAAAWRDAKTLLLAQPRTTIVFETAEAIRVEQRSKVFGFVDVIDLRLRAGTIAVRSGSTFALFDWGVNRSRVERLRDAYRARRRGA